MAGTFVINSRYNVRFLRCFTYSFFLRFPLIPPSHRISNFITRKYLNENNKYDKTTAPYYLSLRSPLREIFYLFNDTAPYIYIYMYMCVYVYIPGDVGETRYIREIVSAVL